MKNKKGFTLVECVVAIAVISIITASAIGIYQTALNSSNRQWNRYLSTVMADNALACFQSTDNMSDFESKLSELQADGNIIKNPGADVMVTATYNELVLSGGQAVETPFQKVRAWNNKENKGGLVQFLKDDGTSVADFSYDSVFSNTDDKKIFNSDQCYAVSYEENEKGVVSEINVTATSKFTLKITENTVTLSADGNKKTYDTTLIEKYFLKKGLFLYPDKNTSKACTSNGKKGYLYYHVYDCRTGGKYKNTENKYMYVRIYGSFNHTGVWWYQGTVNSFAVTSVECNYSENNVYTQDGYSTVTDENGNELATSSASVSWPRYPAYALDCYQEYNTVNVIDKVTYVEAKGEMIYTDYTLKSNYVSKIIYELKSNGKIEIYASGDIKLYSYTGNKISDAHNEIVEKCAFSKDATYSGTSGTEKYTCVQDSDGIQMTSVSYDEQAKKIKFMNGATEVISFEYGTNADAFENDKPTAQNSAYSAFYENNTIKNPDNLSISVQRIPVNSTSFCYQISLINTDGTQTAIFSTSYGNISTNQGASFSGPEKTKSVMIDGASYTQYFYYIPSGSNVGCYIMVTFSKVSSGDTSVEPKIKAWILSASDITALQNDSRSDKTQNDILKRNRCYISYRKG